MKTTEISRFILQPNIISRASYSLSTTARRLIAMAMSMLPTDGSTYEVSFPVQDFEKSLGIKKSGLQRDYLVEAVRECLDSHIEILVPKGNGKATWIGFTWFTKSYFNLNIGLENYADPYFTTYDPNDDITSDKTKEWQKSLLAEPTSDDLIVMEFNPLLGNAIKEFKKAYAKLDLINFGKLQSSYAIRYYEIAMSWSGMAGQNGNKENEWFFEKSIKELRMLFKIDKNKYKATGNFRIRIIDSPIKELNEAKIGIQITIEYIRKGKYLIGAKFNCKFVEEKRKKATQKAITAKETAVSDDKEDISPKEIEELRGKYPAEWEKIYEEEKKKYLSGMKKIGVTELKSTSAKIVEEIALARLKQELGL